MYTSLPLHIDPCVCTTVKKLSRVLVRHYDAELAPAGINVTQFAVLRHIARLSGHSLARIAEELEMDRTSLYRAIAPMVRDGWLAEEDGADARSRTARLTKKGQKVLDKANELWDVVQERVIGGFGKKEYRGLVGEMYRLAGCLD